MIGIDFSFGAGGPSQVHSPAALCLKLARPTGFGMGALPARYCGWLIGETLAGLLTPFIADLIRLQQERYPKGSAPDPGRLTSIIIC